MIMMMSVMTMMVAMAVVVVALAAVMRVFVLILSMDIASVRLTAWRGRGLFVSLEFWMLVYFPVMD